MYLPLANAFLRMVLDWEHVSHMHINVTAGHTVSLREQWKTTSLSHVRTVTCENSRDT